VAEAVFAEQRDEEFLREVFVRVGRGPGRDVRARRRVRERVVADEAVQAFARLSIPVSL
jgi:hypothetical protein